VHLTPEQQQAWQRDGFVVIERLIGEAALASLRAAYDDILSRRVPAAGDRMLGGITRQVMMACTAHPAFRQNEALDEAAEIAEQLLGEPPARTFDMLIDKPPGHPHATPWHQDMSYAGFPLAPAGAAIPLETIQFWVALDDVDAENGCMHFLPGHHTRPLLAHRVAAGLPSEDSRLLELVDAERQVDLSRAVAAPLRAGGATLHSYGTPHYTPPNRTQDRPRRAFIFNLAPLGLLERTAASLRDKLPPAALEEMRRLSVSFRRERR
jgi:ectoine hydroxylase-related dioxygenase (phytanoyl-CoA dioxygenase family)